MASVPGTVVSGWRSDRASDHSRDLSNRDSHKDHRTRVSHRHNATSEREARAKEKSTVSQKKELIMLGILPPS